MLWTTPAGPARAPQPSSPLRSPTDSTPSQASRWTSGQLGSHCKCPGPCSRWGTVVCFSVLYPQGVTSRLDIPICGCSSPPHRFTGQRHMEGAGTWPHPCQLTFVLSGTWAVASTDTVLLCEATTSPQACTRSRETISTSCLRTSGEGTSPSPVTAAHHFLTCSEECWSTSQPRGSPFDRSGSTGERCPCRRTGVRVCACLGCWPGELLCELGA